MKVSLIAAVLLLPALVAGAEGTLADMANEIFRDLYPSEALFIEQHEAGQATDFRAGEEEKDDPANARNWGDERVLRAKVLEWFCREKSVRDRISDRGIRILGARIDGKVDLSNLEFGLPLFLHQCVISEDFSASEAQFEILSFQGSKIASLAADGIHISRDLSLRNCFVADGEVSLLRASIGGNLVCDGGTFRNPNSSALTAKGIRVTGGIFLGDGFEAEGEVRLLGASIGRNLNCDGGTFFNPNGSALSAEGIRVGDGVFLNDRFKAKGEVCLVGASIGHDLNCMRGAFHNANGEALCADRIRVTGSVFLNGECLLEGEVSFVHAEALEFQYLGLLEPQSALLDLRAARFDSIRFDSASLPDRGNLWLHGMTYDSIDVMVDTNEVWWINFIERQTTKSPDSAPDADEAKHLEALDTLQSNREKAESSRLFFTQPYEQAAKVLRAHGHVQVANAILIAKEDARGRAMPKFSFQWPWHMFKKILMEYGYDTSRAFGIAIVIVLFGWTLFSLGYRRGLMRPVRPEDRLAFVSFIYALETFTPLVNLNQAEHWLPNTDTRSGRLLAWYLYWHTIAGWLLTTLLVTALTGLMRQT